MLADWLRLVAGGEATTNSRLVWAVIFGTVPAAVVGLLIKDFVELYLRSPLIIAGTTIGFGVLLGWADVWGSRRPDEHTLNWKDVLVIGCAQALAVAPGTSRSGVTITAGLAMGLTRKAAARFSFLLSIPIILLAGGYLTVSLVWQPERVDWGGRYFRNQCLFVYSFFPQAAGTKWHAAVCALPFGTWGVFTACFSLTQRFWPVWRRVSDGGAPRRVRRPQDRMR
jgi:undecaprenyl pyrophosphate phosphatase UppP